MRRRRFKHWTDWTRFCRFLPDVPNATVSSTYRHGTLSLYAALDTATGRVHGKTAARHTSREFVAFLKEVVALCAREQADSHHPGQPLGSQNHAVREFLDRHPRVHFHFTPTYSSWLNQVELWFAKIERDVIARGIFTSVSDLARKLRRYINAYSANATPFRLEVLRSHSPHSW